MTPDEMRAKREPARPEEWPPRVGSVWADRDGDEWTSPLSGLLVAPRGVHGQDAENIWDWYGPLTFVRNLVTEEPF